MIWGGGGGKIENEFIFSAAMPFEIELIFFNKAIYFFRSNAFSN